MTLGRSAFDGRVLAGLLVLNLVAHFVPFERPGFQTDDFMWLHHSRVPPAWSFVPLSLSQETRPLGWLLYILVPKLVGLHEATQLAILVGLSSVLTGLVYLFLIGVAPRAMANLAALTFVVWPVKHEIYSSQVVGVGILAAVLIVASGLLYRSWVRDSSPAALALALLAYTLSIFIYELGYLAPLVFHLSESSRKPRARGLALFLIPALLYWVFRLTHAHAAPSIGEHPLSLSVLGFNLMTSLPSNLAGFQVARNLGYGLWGLFNAPLWVQGFGAVTAVVLGLIGARWIRDAQQDAATVTRWETYASAGLLSGALLALPAAMVLVESRHSILASAGIGVVMAAILLRLSPALGAAALALLLLASQGLAFRQAEAAQLQSSVYDVLAQRREEIRTADAVVVDLASLADRVPYTFGERTTNVLRGYWGIFAFSSGGFTYMIEDVLQGGTGSKQPRVGTCAAGLVTSEVTVHCEQSHAGGRPFDVPRAGTLVIDFTSMPLPPTIHPTSPF